ncbi:MAG: hypothetical protein WA478_05555, partial [Pseudolabrys sp.]
RLPLFLALLVLILLVLPLFVLLFRVLDSLHFSRPPTRAGDQGMVVCWLLACWGGIPRHG